MPPDLARTPALAQGSRPKAQGTRRATLPDRLLIAGRPFVLPHTLSFSLFLSWFSRSPHVQRDRRRRRRRRPTRGDQVSIFGHFAGEEHPPGIPTLLLFPVCCAKPRSQTLTQSIWLRDPYLLLTLCKNYRVYMCTPCPFTRSAS